MDSTLQTLRVHRVPSSANLEKKGDYVLVPKREPERRFETISGEPSGFWQRIVWVITGRKPIVKEVIEALWPEYDAIKPLL